MFRFCYQDGFKSEEITSDKKSITHNGYKSGDLAQLVIQYAYDYSSGDMGFIEMIECESAFNPSANGDGGHAWGVCQNNDRFRKVSDEFKTDWKVQVEICYKLYNDGVAFYGPSRMIKGQRCSNYVKDRFIIN